MSMAAERDLLSMRTNERVKVRSAEPGDAAPIAIIYNHYVTGSIATFEEEPVSAVEIGRRMAEVQSATLPWLIVEEGAQLLGYCYAAPWRARSAYRFSVEITIYLAPGNYRRGIGSLLYTHLFFELRKSNGIHAAMAGIALPNQASVALHEKFGLRKVAHFREVGFKFNHWIDVGYWQSIL